MPHKFDGKWSFYEMAHQSAANAPGRKDDMILRIPEDNGNVDEDHSSQGDFNRIDGNITGKTVELVANDDANKVKRTLHGRVLMEEVCNGQLFATIAGRYIDDDAKKDQEQGTWVLTKP